jgi:LDH2 family malate/lactate/ureidoglycolate dehydrogenase
MILLPADDLRATAKAIFRAAGADPEPTSILVNHLIDANLAGHDSHGVQHIPGYVAMMEKGVIRPNARPEVTRETAVSALIDGHWTFGQVSLRFAIDRAIAKAKESGVAVVGVLRCTHIGRLGTYSTLAAREGVVVMITTGYLDSATVPYGGRQGIFGTNPFSFGFPAGDRPDVMIDFATTVIAAGKVEVARAKHECVPPGCLLDKDGNPTTDPEVIYQGGMMLPFGGHKGSALATLSVLLSHVLVPASADVETFGLPGTLIIAIDAGLFRDRAAVERETDGVIDKIKSVPPAPGFDEVLVAGEPEVRAAQRRSREGIPVPEDTWAAIMATAHRLGVTVATPALT